MDGCNGEKQEQTRRFSRIICHLFLWESFSCHPKLALETSVGGFFLSFYRVDLIFESTPMFKHFLNITDNSMSRPASKLLNFDS